MKSSVNQGDKTRAFVVNENLSFSGSSVVARVTNGTDHYQSISVSLAVFFFFPVLNTIVLYYNNKMPPFS